MCAPTERCGSIFVVCSVDASQDASVDASVDASQDASKHTKPHDRLRIKIEALAAIDAVLATSNSTTMDLTKLMESAWQKVKAERVEKDSDDLDEQ